MRLHNNDKVCSISLSMANWPHLGLSMLVLGQFVINPEVAGPPRCGEGGGRETDRCASTVIKLLVVWTGSATDLLQHTCYLAFLLGLLTHGCREGCREYVMSLSEKTA